MDNRMIAEAIMKAVGGRDNVASVSHCATRLRFIVHDKEKIDQQSVEAIDKVKGSLYNSGQYQVILGTGTVNKIFEEIESLSDVGKDEGKQSKHVTKPGNAFQRAVRTFGDVFVPIIPVLVATGLFMGLRDLLMREQVLALFNLTLDDISDSFILYTQILTDTAFIFLPALVAWSAFKVFGGTPVIGLILGLMLVSPSIPYAWSVPAGEEMQSYLPFIPIGGYGGAVLPAFIVGLVGAKLERLIRKRVPEFLDLIITPFLTLLLMSTLAFFVIGPIFHTVEESILKGTVAVLSLPFGLAGLIIGFFNQLIVITGVHHIFTLFEIQLLAKFGNNPYNAMVTAAVAAQGGAALAVGLKTKSKKLKALALPSSLSAFLGITEPAIFGVNLRYGKPFVMGLIGGAAGGMVAALVHLKATGMAITVIPGALLYMNEQILLYVLVNLIGMAVAFVLTWLFGFSDAQVHKGEIVE